MRLVTRNFASGAAAYRRDQHRGGIDDLLEVVEHDQHAPARQRVRDALFERGFAVVADAEGVRDRRHEQSRLEHALEQHEVDAVGEEVLARARRLDREPALADAAGPDQADDPALAAREQVAHARRGRPRGRSSPCRATGIRSSAATAPAPRLGVAGDARLVESLGEQRREVAGDLLFELGRRVSNGR